MGGGGFDDDEDEPVSRSMREYLFPSYFAAQAEHFLVQVKEIENGSWGCIASAFSGHWVSCCRGQEVGFSAAAQQALARLEKLEERVGAIVKDYKSTVNFLFEHLRGKWGLRVSDLWGSDCELG